MKTVLLPTDFSANSKNAVKWALNFYQNEQVKFVLIHSYFSPQSGSSAVVSINEILRKQAIEDLDKYKNELETAFPNNKNEIVFKEVYGDVLYAIKSISEELNNVEVVVGAKGMSAMEEIFVGSNTSAVVKEADAPVYVIPENVVYNDVKKIALAIDFQDNLNNETLLPLKDVLVNKKAELRVFYVEDEDGAIEEEQQNRVVADLESKLNQKIDVLKINEDDSLSAVQKFIHTHKIDCLVTINRKKSFFESLFHRSFSKQVALHTDTPLLVLHD